MSLNPSLDVRSPHHEDVDEDARQEADDDRRQGVLHRNSMPRNNLLTDKGSEIRNFGFVSPYTSPDP